MRRKDRVAHSGGYVRVRMPSHPLAMKDGYVLEHRLVLHEAGIDIPKGAHVHHKNEDRSDNRLENLEVKSPRSHLLGHMIERGGFVVNQSGTWPLVTDRECATCGGSFRPWKPTSRFCSRACANRREVSA